MARLHSASSTSVTVKATDGRPAQISQTFDVRLERSHTDVDVNASSGVPVPAAQQGDMPASNEPVRLSDLEVAAWFTNGSRDPQAATASSPHESLGASSMSSDQTDEDDRSAEQALLGTLGKPSLPPPHVELSRGWARLLTVARRYPVGAFGAAIVGVLVVLAFGLATMRIATTMMQPTQALHGSALQ
jgi:hypothetical protein